MQASVKKRVNTTRDEQEKREEEESESEMEGRWEGRDRRGGERYIKRAG